MHKNSSLWAVVAVVTCILFSLHAPQAHANIQIDHVTGIIGGTVEIGISFDNAPNLVEAFQMDLFYNTSFLDYADSFSAGDLVSNFAFFGANEISPGVVRIAGAEPMGIPAGASGRIVLLEFEVVACPSTETALEVKDLRDDIEDWISSLGSFACVAGEEGEGESEEEGSEGEGEGEEKVKAKEKVRVKVKEKAKEKVKEKVKAKVKAKESLSAWHLYLPEEHRLPAISEKSELCEIMRSNGIHLLLR